MKKDITIFIYCVLGVLKLSASSQEGTAQSPHNQNYTKIIHANLLSFLNQYQSLNSASSHNLFGQTNLYTLHYMLLQNLSSLAHDNIFFNHAMSFGAQHKGIASQIQVNRTFISAMYFNENVDELKKFGVMEGKRYTSEAKLGFEVPYINDLRLFGGYSYNQQRNGFKMKGLTVGVQAKLFKYFNVDSTVQPQKSGKSIVKLMFNFSIPTSQFQF